MTTKVRTLHPEGKNGVNISLEKYETLKEFILNMIKKNGTIAYKELDSLARKELQPEFEGSVSWFLVTVKLDLEARGIIQRLNQKGGHAIKLK